jgi:hypothetical protein
MKSVSRFILTCLFLSLAGCGAHVGERVMFQPTEPRSPDCSFEFVDIPNSSSKINEQWVVLGAVETESPEQNVMSEEHRNLVQKDVCKMGGEAVGMWTSSSFNLWGTWYRTIYLVPKPRTGDEEGGKFNPDELPGFDA